MITDRVHHTNIIKVLNIARQCHISGYDIRRVNEVFCVVPLDLRKARFFSNVKNAPEFKLRGQNHAGNSWSQEEKNARDFHCAFQGTQNEVCGKHIQ